MLQNHLQTYYTNPLVLDDFPDPCVIQVQGKGFFAFGTHDEFSPTENNILVRHSWDLVNWSKSDGALLLPPKWAEQTHRFWCPHVAQVNGKFRLYYATEPDTKDGMCLALAVSDSPSDFIDCGEPINQMSGSTFQMIDPCFFIDPVTQRHLLYYGSAHEPIRVVELAADGKTFVSKPTEVLFPGATTFHKLREAAFVTYNEVSKRFFLWVSGDNTWAEDSYAVSVFWSTDPMAVFESIPGTNVVLQPNSFWDSPGHNSIIKDAVGNEWMFYHAVDRNDKFIPGTDRFLRRMCMDRVRYTEDGWPYIETSSPSYTKQQGPIVVVPAA